MPPLGTKEIEVRAQVLERHLSGESYLRLHLLCAENGRLVGMWRIANKKGAAPPPDLFDVGMFRLRAGAKDVWFIQEFRLEAHHSGISRRYRNLQAASEWGQFLWRNLLHAESFGASARLCEQVMGAFAEYEAPSAILLKAQFSIARSEGYAVAEDWLNGIAASARERATHILNNPLKELDEGDERIASQQLLPSLQRWMRLYTDFDLPSAGQNAGRQG